MIRVAVAGAAGRMGEAVCEAVQGADDMELTGRADPLLGTTLEQLLSGAEVVVDFTRPDAALQPVSACRFCSVLTIACHLSYALARKVTGRR